MKMSSLGRATAVPLALVVALASQTTAQSAPSQASLRLVVAKGCSVEVRGPNTAKKLKKTRTLKHLRPGTYRLSSPAKCRTPKKITVRKGQRKKVRVRKGVGPKTRPANPRQVPSMLTGSFNGSEVSGYTQDVKWSGTVTLIRTGERDTIGSLNFPFATHYRVEAASGTVSPIPVAPNPDICYGQTGSRTFGTDDIDDYDGGDSFPGATFDPWGWAGHGSIYNISVQSTNSSYSVVGSQYCPKPDGPPEQQDYVLTIPSELLLTDGWTGLPSNSQPVVEGDRFAGSYSYGTGDETLSWQWDLRGTDYVTVNGPESVPDGDVIPLVP